MIKFVLGVLVGAGLLILARARRAYAIERERRALARRLRRGVPGSRARRRRLARQAAKTLIR